MASDPQASMAWTDASQHGLGPHAALIEEGDGFKPLAVLVGECVWLQQDGALIVLTRTVADRLGETIRAAMVATPRRLSADASEVSSATPIYTDGAAHFKVPAGPDLRRIAEAIYAEVADEPLGELADRTFGIQLRWQEAIGNALAAWLDCEVSAHVAPLDASPGPVEEVPADRHVAGGIDLDDARKGAAA